MLGVFVKICQENPKIYLQSGKNMEYLTVKPKWAYCCGGINSLLKHLCSTPYFFPVDRVV